MTAGIQARFDALHLPPENALESVSVPQNNSQSNQNSVGTAGGSPPSQASGGAADGAREATEPTKSGWQLVNEEVEARLSADPEYAELKAKYDAHEGMADDFAIVDQAFFWGRGDGALDLGDIQAVANDSLQTDEARNAAKRLLKDMAVFTAAAGGNNQLTRSEVMEFLNGLKGDLSARRASMTEKVEAEHAKRETGVRGSTSANGTPSSDSATEAAPIVMSSRPGVEGAMENLGNVADSLQAQMLELAKKAAEDPSKAVQYQQQIAQLQNQYQAITNMMNQLTQMLSNLSKMWSDVAMNSIRNVK